MVAQPICADAYVGEPTMIAYIAARDPYTEGIVLGQRWYWCIFLLPPSMFPQASSTPDTPVTMSDHSENEKGTPDVATDLTTERLSDSTGDGSHITVNQNWASPSSFFRWFHPDDEPAERSLILKLDLSILTFACIGIWVRVGN